MASPLRTPARAASGRARLLAAGLAAAACLIAPTPPLAQDGRAAVRGPGAPAAALPALRLPRLPPSDTDRDGVPDADDACPRSGRGVRVSGDGCLDFEPGPDGIRFAPGSAWLDPTAERHLARALATLERFPRKRFEVLARAGTAGDEARALRMALLRAETVVAWFDERGVGRERSDVVAIAGGPAPDRRVELRLLR